MPPVLPARVLVVTNMWPSQADPVFGVFVREQVGSLRRLGLRVDVAFVDGRDRTQNYLRALPHLRALLATGRYELVHAHYVLAGLCAWLAGAGSARGGPPLLLTHHGIEVYEGWQARLARWLTPRADRAIVMNAEMALALGLGPESVLPCGVDLDCFRPGPKAAARAALGLYPARRYVAWAGVDRPEKRLHLARAAVDRLRAGTAADVALLQVSGRPHSDVARFLQAADVLLVTSRREGGPLVAKEALACDRPVVGTDVGDLRSVLAGVPGCAVVPESGRDLVEGLARALATALEHPEVPGRRAVERFALPLVAERIASVYADLVAGGVRVVPAGAQLASPSGQPPAVPSRGRLQAAGRREPPASPGRERRKVSGRVLVLRHGYYPQDPRLRREIGALQASGYRVDVICLRGPGERSRERVGGVTVWRAPLGHVRGGGARYLAEYSAFFVYAALLASTLDLREPFQVLQVNTMPDALVFAAWLPKRRGARVVLDLHELMPELYASKFGVGPGHPLPRLLARIEQAAIRFADQAIAVSQPCLERYLARGADPARFAVVMNAPDPALFFPRSRNTPKPIGVLCLVSHGTLVDRYGFDDLIRALAILSDSPALPAHHLVVVGDGEAKAGLERLAAALGVADRVTFTGAIPLDAVPGLLAGADIGVVANRSDPFTDLVVPTKLMEYIAMQLPAVAPDTPAIRRSFGAHAVALFRPGDPADLARSLARLLAEPGLRQDLVFRAALAVRGRIEWPVMARRYLAVVRGPRAR